MAESVTREELIFRKVCKEMGIEWKNDKGESVVDGIPVSDWFLMHNIFNDEEIHYFKGNQPIYYKRITMDMLDKIKNNKMDRSGWDRISNEYFISNSFLDAFGKLLNWNYYTKRIMTYSIQHGQSMGDAFYDKWYFYIDWMEIIDSLPAWCGPSRYIISKHKDLIMHQYKILLPDHISKEDSEEYLKIISDKLKNY